MVEVFLYFEKNPSFNTYLAPIGKGVFVVQKK